MERVATTLFADETVTSALRVFVASVGSFALMYFAFAAVAWVVVSRIFPAMHVGVQIDSRPPGAGQVAAEIRGSIVSIFLFGVVAVFMHALIVSDQLVVSWDTSLARMALEVVALLVWNEVHFYTCHRLLHTSWLFRRVHLEHHRSIRVTPLAAYRFHWFEALLLSSVMPLAMLAHDFTVWALLVLPPASLVLNMFGHANYDIAPGATPDRLAAFGRRHSDHHHDPNRNFGFFTPYLDRLFGTASGRPSRP